MWLLIDLALVGGFAVIGRLSHYGSLSLDGWWSTAWPFLLATLLTWATLAVTRRPSATIASGLVLWVGTLVIGMVLRQASGQGTAVPFVVVATLVLGALLVLPRVGRRLVRRDA